MSPPTVLIAGCGDLGTAAGLELAARGWRPVGLRRSPERLPSQILGIAVDLADPDRTFTERLPDRVDALVYTPAASERTPEGYRRTYLEGLVRVLDHLDATGRSPARLVQVSSTAVYGDADGRDVDEDTPTSPASATAEVLVAAEEALHERRPDAITLRLAGIYGPGRTWLIEQVRSGEARLPPTPAVTNRIHRDDAARAIAHLVVDVEAPASHYLGVDDEPVDLAEVLRFLAQELGLPDPPPGDEAPRRGGSKRVRNTRLRASGFEPRYPSYREGYRSVLAGEGVRYP